MTLTRGYDNKIMTISHLNQIQSLSIINQDNYIQTIQTASKSKKFEIPINININVLSTLNPTIREI